MNVGGEKMSIGNEKMNVGNSPQFEGPLFKEETVMTDNDMVYTGYLYVVNDRVCRMSANRTITVAEFRQHLLKGFPNKFKCLEDIEVRRCAIGKRNLWDFVI